MKNSAEEAKLIAMGKSNNNNGMKNISEKNEEERDIKEAINLLENYSKRNNKNEIESEQINNLFNDNKLIETDVGYEILF